MEHETSIKIIIGVILGVLCLIAVQQHWISGIFSYIMSFVTEDFTMRFTSYIPDILILLSFILMVIGIIHLIQYYISATIICVLAIALITGYYKYDMNKSHKPVEYTTITSHGN